jgi:hypothetical protein
MSVCQLVKTRTQVETELTEWKGKERALREQTLTPQQSSGTCGPTSTDW